jgi:hypothetical protein
MPVYFLKAVLKAETELKPASNPISATLILAWLDQQHDLGFFDAILVHELEKVLLQAFVDVCER